jgi:hypothetical protein
MLILGVAGATRFIPHVRTVDAVGLLACGALVGVSIIRLTGGGRR